MKSADVLLVTQEEETSATVRSALQSGAAASTPSVYDNMMALRARLSKTVVNGVYRIAVVDIDKDADHTLFEMSRLIAIYPHVRFVVISKEFDEKLVLHAMQAGARHFLRKSSIPEDLNGVLDALFAYGSKESTQLGALLSVFSCGGGCGATTVTINLANELQLATGGRVLIVDMDLHYGAAAAYLGVKGRYGISHILARQGTIDKQLIQSTAIACGEGLDVLLSPASAQVDADTAMNYVNLPTVLEVCRESYNHVVIDAPRVPRQVAVELASASRISMPVFQLTVRDVEFAGAMISYLVDQGIPRDRILPVANRVRSRGALVKLEDSRRIIGAGALHTIRSNWSKAAKSASRSRPLSEVAHRSGLRRDYRRLAAHIQQNTSNGNH